jgi:hypothetical protein
MSDFVYPMRPWLYYLLKGEKYGLRRAKMHWNFIHSSTRMAVEITFGILKGRWRILLKRIGMPRRHILIKNYLHFSSQLVHNTLRQI